MPLNVGVSRVTEYLSILLQRHKLSQSDVAKKSGVPFAVINRTLGGHTKISDKNWATLITAMTDDEDEQAEALCCRMRDQLNGPGCHRVEIRVKADRMEDRLAPLPVETPLSKAIRHLQEFAGTNPDMRHLLIDLARVTKADIPRKQHPSK